MKPHGEKFLVPALSFAISGRAPTGRKAQEIQAQIQTSRAEWQNQYDPKILVGKGSQNIPLLAAACGLGFTYEKDPALHQKVLAGWRGYLTLPWWANEPGSRDIYSIPPKNLRRPREFSRHVDIFIHKRCYRLWESPRHES